LGRAGTAGNRSARGDKDLGPQLGERITRETASQNRRDVTHGPSAEGRVRRKGAAPLCGGKEQTARAISDYTQHTCLLSLQMGIMK